MASLASAVSREGVTDVPETVAPPAAVQTDYEMSATTLDLTGAESPIASDCSAAGDSSADEGECACVVRPSSLGAGKVPQNERPP